MEPDPLIMDRQTLLSLPGGDFVTETILFYFTGAGLLSFACTYDGWVAGWAHALSTGVAIAINVDPPTSAISVQGVYSGLVLPPLNTQEQVANLHGQGVLRNPFKAGDIIKVRSIPASANSVLVWLGRSI